MQILEALNLPQTSSRVHKQSRLPTSNVNVILDSNDTDEDLTSTKTRGSRGGKGSRGSRGGRGKGKSNETSTSITKLLV